MTITKLTAPIMLVTALLLAPGCDGEDPSPETELRADLDAPPEAQPAEGAPGHHRQRAHDPAERLCQEIACSDEQRSQIDALFAARKDAHEAKRAERDAHEAARAEHDARLADAFRAETFDPSVLDNVSQFLTQTYFERGKYGVEIETSIIEEPDNRVQVEVVIREGDRVPPLTKRLTDDQLSNDGWRMVSDG